MESSPKSPLLFLAVLLGALLALGSCFFEGETRNKDGGSWEDFPNPRINTCGDITPNQMRAGDSLVAEANPELRRQVDFFASDSALEWDDVKARDLPLLGSQYAAALKAAPNHCGALFGHGIITAAAALNDSRFDSLVRQAGDFAEGYQGAGALMKVSADQAAPALLGLRRALAVADTALLALVQEVGESVLLPRLDSAIRDLGLVAANRDFRFDVDFEGDYIRLDRGEVAPLLASLKYMKAVLYVVVGYRWKAEAGDEFPMLDTLSALRWEDFDNLSLGQRQALDHYTSLVKSGATLTHIRPGYEAKLASIPALLLEMAQHIQDGLAHGIYQAENRIAQGKDPYVVGSGEDADVDPDDLRNGIDKVERVKKYLRGEVPLRFGNGGQTLRVNLPRLFRINGLQGMLPHFRFYAYPLWNDSVPARSPDTLIRDGGAKRLRGPAYFTDAAGKATLDAMALEDYAENLGGLRGKVLFPDPTFGGVFPDLTNENIWSKAESLRGVESKVREVCAVDSSSGHSECETRLPADASDLDLLDYYLFRGLF